MATGLSTKLTGQVGEFLVCAELGRTESTTSASFHPITSNQRFLTTP